MRTAHSAETVRAAERALMAELPEGALMQRAAAGLAAACADLLGRVYGSRIVLLVGSGDNGGDALYAGARLARRGAGATAVLLAPERTHEGGLAALRGAGGQVTTPADAGPALARADLVLDGIVGIGGKGGLRPEAAELAAAVRESDAVVVAVDLPSGIEADTGEVLGEAVRADATVTFGTYKPGLLIDPARSYAGAVRLVDIGLDLPAVPELEALQYADVAALLPEPGAESDKYRRGVVGIAAGSATYPGAAVLAVAGALRGGAGAVRYSGPAGDEVLARFPETLVHAGPPSAAGRVQAWVVGPGIGEDAARVADVLAQDVPVLVDADGLRLADPQVLRSRTAPTVLTPHAGEAAALLGVPREEVESARLASVRRLAAEFSATVLLKGSTTLVAPADGGPVRANPTGTSWLATAGSGDVLSGLSGALLAAGLSGVDAASVGAYLHGLAGRRAASGAPASAQDVAAAIPEVWRDVRGEAPA
ncbi:NAD(P)H-hydrate dehydratase [Streptomyces indicus]|uniref:Bifunctional NAD(P)H-hydrate repair enzyme n=1 Tax=Streptomyces indicus TaxID=417292 RepID=A0A1G9EBJ6_9ACTN|nr:NAD(P)H-hydrate dehydratase [Streptomyces indicus]SDK73494.1 yjeF C-terminal region, hydroxyethylthiazole kinase-related/yjeF N-terminal region [Streptomyces indicus]